MIQASDLVVFEDEVWEVITVSGNNNYVWIRKADSRPRVVFTKDVELVGTGLV